MSRGRLTAILNPPRLLWDGQPIPGTFPAQARLMASLIRCGQMETGDLAMLLRDDTQNNAVAVHFSKLRHAFAAANIPAQIKSIFGWGYRLVMEEDG